VLQNKQATLKAIIRHFTSIHACEAYFVNSSALNFQ